MSYDQPKYSKFEYTIYILSITTIYIKKHIKNMHQFNSIAGIKHKECIPVAIRAENDISKDGTYYKAVEIAKATCTDHIMLFREYNNKLTLVSPFDIIDEPTCFVVVNINDRTLKFELSCKKN